jgi:hypothetical protein
MTLATFTYTDPADPTRTITLREGLRGEIRVPIDPNPASRDKSRPDPLLRISDIDFVRRIVTFSSP